MNFHEKKKECNITAGEILNELESDPKYLHRMEELEKNRQQAIKEYMQAADLIFKDLSLAGLSVTRLSDFYKKEEYCTKSNYLRAIPILLYWLPRIENLRVKEDIVRMLSVKWARPLAAPALIQEFISVNDPLGSYKWALGNALSILADDSVFEGIVDIVQNQNHGKAREMVVVALGNMKDPRAVDVLIEMLKDEEVAGHALLALRKLKADKARPYIEPFLEHPKAWVRKEAKRALAKIDKAK